MNQLFPVTLTAAHRNELALNGWAAGRRHRDPPFAGLRGFRGALHERVQVRDLLIVQIRKRRHQPPRLLDGPRKLLVADRPSGQIGSKPAFGVVAVAKHAERSSGLTGVPTSTG